MKNICVFCGSNEGARREYCRSASELGQELARRGIGLVYGGASIGCMGAVADSVLEAGGAVTGVMPRYLVEKEIAHKNLTELHVVESMHERKALMAELSDGFIALPGGMGTFEEFFEVLTWAQLGLHEKPCGLLDVAGYYELLVAFLDHAQDELFFKREHRDMVLRSSNPDTLLDIMVDYRPKFVAKWIKDLPQT